MCVQAPILAQGKKATSKKGGRNCTIAVTVELDRTKRISPLLLRKAMRKANVEACTPLEVRKPEALVSVFARRTEIVVLVWVGLVGSSKSWKTRKRVSHEEIANTVSALVTRAGDGFDRLVAGGELLNPWRGEKGRAGKTTPIGFIPDELIDPWGRIKRPKRSKKRQTATDLAVDWEGEVPKKNPKAEKAKKPAFKPSKKGARGLSAPKR